MTSNDTHTTPDPDGSSDVNTALTATKGTAVDFARAAGAAIRDLNRVTAGTRITVEEGSSAGDYQSITDVALVLHELRALLLALQATFTQAALWLAWAETGRLIEPAPGFPTEAEGRADVAELVDCVRRYLNTAGKDLAHSRTMLDYATNYAGALAHDLTILPAPAATEPLVPATGAGRAIWNRL